MSEILRAQEPLFESGAQVGQLGEYDNDADFVEFYNALAQKYSLDPELAQLGAQWALDWWDGLQYSETTATVTVLFEGEKLTFSDLSKEDILAARNKAAEFLPIPKDTTENQPTFRVQFAADEAFHALSGNAYRTLLEGKGAHIIPNFERIDYVFKTLLDSYDRKLYPYNLDSTRVPQDIRHTPRNLQTDIEQCTEADKIRLASFWFADCYYMRGVNDSNDMTINLAKLYEDHPEIFAFETAMNMDPTDIERLLLEYHLPVQHKQISQAWAENSRRMVERYDGDARKMFDDFGTYDNLVKRIRNDSKGGGFIGFQKKMASMLGYYYMSIGLVPYQNIPLPVDFHVMRMAISQELITFENMGGQVVPFENTTDLLRKLTFDFADRHGISQLDLCDVVWSYSREACVNSPTNSQNITGKRQGRKTVWVPALINAADATPKQLDAYRQSCGICRLKETCAHNVPSGRYYVSGEIWWPDPKLHLDHPQDDLHQPSILELAQKPVFLPNDSHAIDQRDQSRAARAEKRIAAVRALAQSALFPLTAEDEVRITATLIEANGNPVTSMSGKKFGFSDDEIVMALGNSPDPSELAAIRAYRVYPATR